MKENYTENWIPLKRTIINRITGKSTMFVFDYLLPDGSYLLDRYFIRHKVHIRYPEKDGGFKKNEFPNCMAYQIVFSNKDFDNVKAALHEMYSDATLFDSENEYYRFTAELRTVFQKASDSAA